jgi:hypothetical protein
MDITAKKISILSGGITGEKIFEADGTDGKTNVYIGGFNVGSNALSAEDTNNGKVTLSASKLTFGENEACTLAADGSLIIDRADIGP